MNIHDPWGDEPYLHHVPMPRKIQTWNEVMDDLIAEKKRILQAREFKGCSRTLLRLKLQTLAVAQSYRK